MNLKKYPAKYINNSERRKHVGEKSTKLNIHDSTALSLMNSRAVMNLEWMLESRELFTVQLETHHLRSVLKSKNILSNFWQFQEGKICLNPENIKFYEVK